LTDFMLLFRAIPLDLYRGDEIRGLHDPAAGFVVLTPVRYLRNPDSRRSPSFELRVRLPGAGSGFFHLGLARYRRGHVQTGLN